MANESVGRADLNVAAILPGFEPLSALWDGDGAPFPSEQSVRWALRIHQRTLADVGAVALLGKRIYIDRSKFLQVVREAAIAAYRSRHSLASSAR